MKYLDKTVYFKDWKCKIRLAEYDNKRTAIILDDFNDNQRIATATTNIPQIVVPANHVLIKTWSENEGMIKSLVDGGIVIPTSVAYDINGDGSIAQLCKLL